MARIAAPALAFEQFKKNIREFLGLAPLVVKQIFSALKMIKQRGTTIFLVEQNANHALQLADRGYVLVNGRVTLMGSGAELLANPEVRLAYLGG